MFPPIDWDRYPNFAEHEFRCKETGECRMDPAFLDRLQALRTALGKPLAINSGYRSPRHSIEARKAKPGAHAAGQAADIHCSSELAFEILSQAPTLGFVGIGVQQKGSIGGRYIHLDTWSERTFPAVWSY